jgi:hypothetical protein
MAVRTVSILGGNWNATTTWVGGVVPVAADTVDFTALSGNLTVNVTTATLAGINFTNYVGTITFNANISVNTSVNLGTGGYTQAGGGTFGLAIGGTTTITSNGVSWNNLLSFFGNTATYTLADNLNVTGNIVLAGTSSITFTGNILYIGGNLTVSSTATALGTTTFNFNGTGTWSYPSVGLIRNNITIDTLGTLTLSGNIYYNTGTLTYISGTVVSTGSVLNIALATTFNTSGMIWRDISITSGTQTLISDLNCEVLRMNNGGNVTINNSGGNIFTLTLIHNSTFVVSGTASINLIGTGTWIHTLTGVISNNLNINTSGTLTISGNVYYQTGTLTYITGKVVTKNSTLILGTSTLINLHKFLISSLSISAGATITMNEFFSGSPSLVTNISSSSTTTNYTIAFQDGFEKIAKFVNISGCTLSKPLQLLVITKSKINSRNNGIRYINQSPNGIAKGEPSVNQTTFGAAGLLPDPIKL